MFQKLAWAGVLAVSLCGCSALMNPVAGPDGAPATNPDGTERLVIDEIVDSGAGLAGLLAGAVNPLWIPLIGAAGAMVKDAVKKKA